MTRFGNYDLAGFRPVLSWNPIIMRCTEVDAGCKHCWHLRMANRMGRNHTFSQARQNIMGGHNPPVLDLAKLFEAVDRKRPTIIATQFMGDLWHPAVDPVDRATVITQMHLCPRHVFLCLTKRPERVNNLGRLPDNVWLGTSVSDQASADIRVPALLLANCKHKWVSVEPMLEPVDLWYAAHNGADTFGSMEGIGFVACGPETGPGARAFDPDWLADVSFQCHRAGVPFYDKRDVGSCGRPTVREWPELWKEVAA